MGRALQFSRRLLYGYLEAGATIEEIMEWFDLARDQVTAVLDFAARSLEVPIQR